MATARLIKAEIKSGRANLAESKSGRSGVLATHPVSKARFMKAETTRTETKFNS